MNFFKSFLASCLGSLIAFAILFFLMIAFLIASVSSLSSDNEEVIVQENSVLHLKLNGPISEMEFENPFEGLPIPGNSDGTIGLLQLQQTLRSAADDSSIKGIYLDVSFFQGGYAKAGEVRKSLIDFRKSGKWIIAYSEMMTEQAYYVASAADKIFLNPEGQLEFNGIAIEVAFYKKMFDKLDIKPEIFRVGDFKSAVEPYMLEKMSDANRLQLNELITDLNSNIVKDIAESRQIEPARLMDISDKMLVTTLEDAMKLHLIDSLLYYDQVLADLRSRLLLDETDDVNFIKYSKYKKTVSNYSSSKNEIAVIVADGEIVPGKAEQGSIGSDTFAEEIRKARTNKNVKAIVLRINSPGGSALASDVMWREVTLAKKEKPVIASMSDYAASGGYYMAMSCDTIVAQPTTITGSIGVFSVLFDLSSFLDNKIGITFDEVKSGEIGELVTFTRALTPLEKAIWQKSTDRIYASFTSKAAEGRRMNVEDLRRVASGRVWSGTQAKEKGLVDILGNFDDAIEVAAAKAGISDDYKLRFYPKYKTFFEEWMSGMEDAAKVKILKQELGLNYQLYEEVKNLKKIQGTQARMPFILKIQ
ncbi:MAG: signal peptide peptidase SppA [Cyclobacteriaceae bacterium]|nr:signal peptide peptidase SppA [Cyclobacteriaceae bacterium]